MKLARFIVIVMAIAAVVITFYPESRDAKPESHQITTVPCRWDDLCNGYASPARIEAHKETP